MNLTRFERHHTTCPDPTILKLSQSVVTPFPGMRSARIPAVIVIPNACIVTVFMANIGPGQARLPTLGQVTFSNIDPSLFSVFSD